MRFLLAALSFLSSGCAIAEELPMRETEWSARIATERGLDPKKACEVRTPDGSRADIVTSEYAYEVEWAYKWKEAPAQAVFYGMTLHRKPAIILLVSDPDDERDEYLRCLAVCQAVRVNGESIRVETYLTKERR